jgi:hypothetical protein
MEWLSTLAQALGISYAAGINLYATVAAVGLADRLGVIGPLPGSLGGMASLWIIIIAGALYIFEFLATLIPGVSSAWETFHSLVRPPAAAVLAAATAWQGDPGLIIGAALLGGGLALTTHTTKLGLRYAIDTSPEPVTNGVANLTDLGIVAAISMFIWNHPFIVLGLALLLLVAMVLMVRLIWRSLRRVFSGHWCPRRGFLQEPRGTTSLRATLTIDDD